MSADLASFKGTTNDARLLHLFSSPAQVWMRSSFAWTIFLILVNGLIVYSLVGLLYTHQFPPHSWVVRKLDDPRNVTNNDFLYLLDS